MSHSADPARRTPVDDESGSGHTGAGYWTLAIVLAIIVTAALAYGLIQTGIRASALFTG